ncbi:hypothetical protein [Bradyrhizobium symbiodeficiens]
MQDLLAILLISGLSFAAGFTLGYATRHKQSKRRRLRALEKDGRWRRY